jgi:hypothetical protein
MSLFSVRSWCRAAFAGGIGLSIVALGSGAYFLNFRLHSLVATGTITSVEVDRDGDKNLYCPHFRFEAADKKTYTGACRVWERSASEPLSVGAVVQIRYRSTDPNDAWREEQVQGYPHDAAIAGVFGLGVGFALLWYARARGIPLKAS